MKSFFKFSFLFQTLLSLSAYSESFICENNVINYSLPNGYCELNKNNTEEKSMFNEFDYFLGKPSLFVLATDCDVINRLRKNNYELKKNEQIFYLAITSDLGLKNKYAHVFNSISLSEFLNTMEKSLQKLDNGNSVDRLKQQTNDRLQDRAKISDISYGYYGRDNVGVYSVVQTKNTVGNVEYDRYGVMAVTFANKTPLAVYLYAPLSKDLKESFDKVNYVTNSIVEMNN